MLEYLQPYFMRLKIQINQIFINPPANKNSSLVLKEENLEENRRLFLLAQTMGLKRKTEALELKKICEIIVDNFRLINDLKIEDQFESALAKINKDLSDLSFKGKKSWLGKLSCAIILTDSKEIMLTSTGAASAWLGREDKVISLIEAEKNADQPLKTFTSFSSGRIKKGDLIAVVTSTIFDFVSLELFERFISHDTAANSVAEILTKTGGDNVSFGCYFIKFGEQSNEPLKEIPYAPLPETFTKTIAQPSEKKFFSYVSTLPIILKTITPKLSLAKLPLPAIKNRYMDLSKPAKFFLISCIIFALLFSINLVAFAVRNNSKKQTEKIETLKNKVLDDLADAESALIYKNNTAAANLLKQANSDFAALEQIDKGTSDSIKSLLTATDRKINKVSIVEQPQLLTQFKFEPKELTKIQKTIYAAGIDSNQLASFNTQARDLFFLNKTESEITGLTNIPGFGLILLTAQNIYKINESQKQLEEVYTNSSANFSNLTTDGSRGLMLNKTTGEVFRFSQIKGKISAPQVMQKVVPDNLTGLGSDKDQYLLWKTGIKKYTNGKEQSFDVPLTNPLTDGQRLVVATFIYILEPAQKRILIINKSAGLVNQIMLPNSNNLKALAVDEPQRLIFFVDGNKLYQVTF